MADPMKIRARLQGDKTQVIVSMSHEMETGQRKDAAGKTVPAWFIQNVKATHNGKVVFSAQFGPAVAKNPNIGFRVSGAKLGDKIIMNWTDNRGESRVDEVAVTPA
jgi:sulfur-oxidizing protein SoxZ